MIAPLPCCEEEPDILIENETIYGETELEFHATNKIIVINSTVEPDAQNLFLKAANEIELLTGTDIKQGANVDIFLETCSNKLVFPASKSVRDHTPQTDSCLNDEDMYTHSEIHNDSPEQEQNNKPSISIRPNPNSGVFDLNISFPDMQKNMIAEVKALNGNTIFHEKYHNFMQGQIHVSLHNYPPGVYIVKVKYDKGVVSKKLIIQ